MSVHCNVKILWENVVRGMLEITLLLPLVLMDSQLRCSVVFSLPGTEPDLAGEGEVNCFGALHTLSAKAQIYCESLSLC